MRRKHLLLFGLILSLLSAASCSTQRAEPEKLVIYPPPPEPTKIQYLTSISDSVDVTGGRSGFMEYIAGRDPEQPIVKPYGITVSKGRIYVSDTILGGLEIIDLEKKKFEYLTPSGRGQLKKPINCFKDADGRLYVADVERGQIVVFDENDKYLDAFGLEDLKKPTDVFTSGNEIFVADIKLKQIVVFSKENFKRTRSLPKPDLPSEQSLFSPTNLFVKGEKLYVSDFGDFKIKIYTTSGDYLRSVGSYGRGIGQFVRPKGIAVDDSFNLYVVDSGFENVQIFNQDGELLLFFGGDYKGPGGMWLPAKVAIDYDNLKYFEQYVDQSFSLKYLIFVTNQYGPDKISVYGFVEPKN